jgi:putative tryptophan/tyrosine transport system substrate-binding protein
MRRREFITLLGGAATAWPLAARAQQPVVPVIGYLNSGSPATVAGPLMAFRKSLSEIGYVEGRNVAIEYRWAEDQYDRLPGLAADLVRRHVAAIVASGAVNSPLAAKAATNAIPIIFMTGSDPVEIGLVPRLNRPGGNVTGVTLVSRELAAKRLEILREIIPNASVIGLLANPSNPNTKTEVSELQTLARSGGWRLQVVAAGTASELDAAFATLAQQKADAFTFTTDFLFITRRGQIATLAARHAIPGMFSFREDVDAGGLISYGPSLPDAYRQLGIYTGRILKGEKAADLPVMQPTKFELVVNLATAKALGLAIPESFLLRADEVIE